MNRIEQPRGYMLLEVMIGGAIAAVIIGTLLTSLADARQRNTLAARDVIAAQLVQEKLEERRLQASRTVALFTALAGGTESPVVNAGTTTLLGDYTRTTTVTNCTYALASTYYATLTAGTTNVNCKEIHVAVTYPDYATRDPSDMKTAEATTVVFEPPPGSP